MKKLLILLCMSSLAIASNEVGCKCKDHTVQAPLCGICGSTKGRMEQTNTGAKCYCENTNILLKKASCREACKNHGGWSGNFSN